MSTKISTHDIHIIYVQKHWYIINNTKQCFSFSNRYHSFLTTVRRSRHKNRIACWQNFWILCILHTTCIFLYRHFIQHITVIQPHFHQIIWWQKTLSPDLSNRFEKIVTAHQIVYKIPNPTDTTYIPKVVLLR